MSNDQRSLSPMESNGNLTLDTSSTTPMRHTVEKHKMGLYGATSYVVGCMIGSGIFITSKGVLQQTGSVGLSLVVWSVTAVISLLGGMTYTELGTSIRHSGGDYAYISYMGWNHLAFLCLWSNIWVYEPGELAVMSKTFSLYVIEALESSYCLSDGSRTFFINALAMLVIALFAFLNSYRIDKAGAGLQIASTVTKLLCLAVMIIVGFVYLARGHTEHYEKSFEGSITDPGALVLAIYGCLWSYAGWYGHSTNKNVPIAILVGTVVVAAVYILTNVAYVTVLGKSGILQSEAIAQTFTEETLGSIAASAVPFLVAIVVFGTINPTVFISSRVYFTGARGGHLPSFMALLHKDHKTPRCALVVNVLLTFIMIQIGGIDWLIDAITPVSFAQKAVSVAALLVIRWKKLPVHPEAIQFPVIIHVLFLVLCLVLVIIPVYQSPLTSLVGIATFASGVPVYLFFIRRETKPETLVRLDERLTIFFQKLTLSELDETNVKDIDYIEPDIIEPSTQLDDESMKF